MLLKMNERCCNEPTNDYNEYFNIHEDVLPKMLVNSRRLN